MNRSFFLLFSSILLSVHAEWTCPGHQDITEDLLSRVCPDRDREIRACCGTHDADDVVNLCSCLQQATEESACRGHVEVGVCSNDLLRI